MNIEGKKIRLRDWQLDDMTTYEHWNTGWHEWMNYDAPYYKSNHQKLSSEYKKKLTESIKNQEFGEPRRRLVIANLETDEMIGMVSRYWESEETNWLCIGIVIYDESHWRNGIGQEAFGLWCQYLWDNMPNIVRLDLRSWSGNPGMMRLAEKLGFQREATFRKARIVKGKYYDSVGYGILKEEWEALFPDGFGAS